MIAINDIIRMRLIKRFSFKLNFEKSFTNFISAIIHKQSTEISTAINALAYTIDSISSYIYSLLQTVLNLQLTHPAL